MPSEGMGRITVLALGSLLTACVPAYTAPVSGPAANLELQMYGGATYRAGIYANAEDCSRRQSLLLLGARAATKVAAGHPLSLVVESEGDLRARGDSHVVGECSLILTFTPDADASYVLTYQHSEAQAGCVAKVFERVMKNGSLSQEQVSIRQRVRLDEPSSSGPQCKVESP